MRKLVAGSTEKWIAKFRHDRFALLIALLSVLGTVHILVRTATYGPAVGSDSTVFLSTAMNFLAGEGWRDFRDLPLLYWPPLFPLLLAASGWVGIEPLAAGRWINAMAFGLTILVAGGWLRSHLRARWLALAATAIIAASLPLNDLASSLMTDSLFCLFVLLALIQLESFLHRGGRTSLLWGAVYTALATLTRWPGVALIGTGVLLLPLARWKQTFVFGAVSSLPLLAVLARNWAITGDLTQATGERKIFSRSLFAELHPTVDVFREWVVPPNAPEGLAYLLGLAVVAVGLAGAAVILHARRMHRAASEPALAYVCLGPVLLFGGFALIYLAFILAVVPFLIFEKIQSRFLLPMYVPLLLTAVVLLDRFLSIEATGWMAAGRRYGLAALVVLATLAHVGYSARENRWRTAQAWDGAGYNHNPDTFNTAYWHWAETLNYLRENPIKGRIYSNRASLLWFADRTTAPGKHQRTMMWWPEIEAGAHIVWLDKFYKRYIKAYDDTDLRVLSGMEIVAELADGTVFRRTAAEPFEAGRHRARKQRYVNQLIHQADEQVRRAGWHVYRTGRRLTYRKKPCVPADVQAKFVLHIVPVDRADLPAKRKRYGFDNLDFSFDWRGERVDDECIAIVRLPAYAIDRIWLGQWISAEDRTLWEAEFAPSR